MQFNILKTLEEIFYHLITVRYKYGIYTRYYFSIICILHKLDVVFSFSIH